MFLQIRADADIAFLGGLMHYALENQRVNKEYLVNFTNAAFIVKKGFKLPEDGLYSGFDDSTSTYDRSTWNYEEGGNLTGKTFTPDDVTDTKAKADKPAALAAMPPNTAYDTSLEHPRTVYQLLKKQYSRYTPEMVERITGIPKADFLKAADLFVDFLFAKMATLRRSRLLSTPSAGPSTVSARRSSA